MKIANKTPIAASKKSWERFNGSQRASGRLVIEAMMLWLESNVPPSVAIVVTMPALPRTIKVLMMFRRWGWLRTNSASLVV